MRLKPLLSGLLIASLGALAPVSLAQDKPPQIAEPVNPEARRLAQGLIVEALQRTHAAEIFADLRRTLREVYIPAVRDMVQGDFPGAPQPDAKAAAAMAKLLTFLDYLRKAGEELDVALAENREAMISDFADQMAKTANPPDLKEVRNILQLPATRKALDALFEMSKLVTGFSYQDSRSFADFTSWASRLNFDFSQALPGSPGGSPQAGLSKRKVAKAQAVVEDLLKVSHFDELATDIRRFARDVYAETAPMSEEDRQQLRDEIDQYEINYTMQKALVIAIAPSVVAQGLTDDQLAILHDFIRAPAFAKAFDLVRNAVRSATAFTKDDILEAQKSLEDLEKQSKLREGGREAQEKAKAEWDALTEKWTKVLKERISPETRAGLERSLEDLRKNGSPI
jgi:hypothetical protein